MRVGAMRIELRLPSAHSLKEKRRPLKSLLSRLRQTFSCAAAEVDHHDLHQRAAVGVALVAADGGNLADQMRAVREYVHRDPECEVLDVAEETYPAPDVAFGLNR